MVITDAENVDTNYGYITTWIEYDLLIKNHEWSYIY